MVAHAAKDDIIEKMKEKVKGCKTSGGHSLYGNKPSKSNRQMLSTSVNNSLANQASSMRLSKNVNSSRDTIIRSLSGMPVFENDAVTIESKIIGAGRFGVIKQAKLHKLGLTVAAKILNASICSKKLILSEAIVGMTLSGHNNFPFCFGLFGEGIILMEYLWVPNGMNFVAAPTLAIKLNSGISRNTLRDTCYGILTAIAFMHSKGILHNDIKTDNVIVSNTAKVIDFGKATLISNPVVYSIAEGSEERARYNSRHRHLAHELRNVPGSKQSVLTDVYSIGFLLKHSAATISHQPVIQLGRMMKSRNSCSRISIENCLDKFRKLME